MRSEHLLIFCSVVVAAWFLVIYFWPHLLLNVYKRALITKGFEGPIPINTLATEPQAIFADPLHPPASATKLATTGVNHDTLLTVGVLDLKDGPQGLHVPDMGERYYSVQFTAPNNTVFAYVGKRATGTRAGDYLITGPGWKGQVPGGVKQISSRHNSVFVIGRILDVATATWRPLTRLRNRFGSSQADPVGDHVEVRGWMLVGMDEGAAGITLPR